MPLKQGTSDKTRSENIAAEIRAGKDPDQAAAIAYDVQRRAKGKSKKSVRNEENPTAPSLKKGCMIEEAQSQQFKASFDRRKEPPREGASEKYSRGALVAYPCGNDYK